MSEQSIVDLRSDTVTRPGAEMYQAMSQAAVGDDVYGEDETVNRLEATGADLLGKAAGLFVSSATQANLIAMMCHCARGEEVLSGDCYHVIKSEAGGASALGGVVLQPLPTDENGSLDKDQVLAAIKPDDPHCPVSRLLSLENTVLGRVQDPDNHREMIEAVRERGLKAHLDGARLMNASIALERPARDIVAPFDSVMLCLSKGLGAPVGALLCGSEEFIRNARRLRKQLGGGMRQAGVIAACGLFALENNIERMAEEHARARRLADGIQGIESIQLRQDTNMVFITPAAEQYLPLYEFLREQQVRVDQQGESLRLVVHLDIDDEGIRFDVDEDRYCSLLHNGRNCGGKGERGSDDFVPSLQIQHRDRQ